MSAPAAADGNSVTRPGARARLRYVIAVGAFAGIVAAVTDEGKRRQKRSGTTENPSVIHESLENCLAHVRAPLTPWNAAAALRASGDMIEAMNLTLPETSGLGFDIAFELHAAFFSANNALRLAGDRDTKRPLRHARWDATHALAPRAISAALESLSSEVGFDMSALFFPDALAKRVWGDRDVRLRRVSPKSLAEDADFEDRARRAVAPADVPVASKAAD